MFLIEDSEGIGVDYQHIIDENVLGDSFPWYWHKSSTSYNFPYLAHVLISRYNPDVEDLKPNSAYWAFFEEIFNGFCAKHGIAVNKILRASLNLTTHHAAKLGEAHTDHLIPHKTVIMYLNEFDDGSTVLFDKYSEGKHEVIPGNEVPILYKISAKKGKVVCFDGLYFHAAESPRDRQRRVICVITFT